ncbi:alpha-keto acid decarboxylase family protein, partial [bacterium]|nr:alpha-keto acid decarboxylase family protein [bacterium]
MNTADYIIKKLEELGVNEFFGLPGDYNFKLLDSIEKNSNTKWIGCTSELNAGYAADGYARLRGYGALVTTYGVGELSAINAIAGSFAENIPVCHIVGLPSTKNIENKELLHHNFQEPDYKIFFKTFENVTAASAFLTRDNAKLEIDRVLKVLVKEKKPVYIAIPSDIALMDISDRYTPLDWDSNKETLKEVAQLIADKINNSDRPVIIGDALIKRFEAKIDFKEFVSKSGIPVTNFLMGANIINSEYENYLGGFFGEHENKIAKEYIDNSDCIIAVGAIESDLNTFGCKLSQDIHNNIAIYGTYTYVDGKRYDNIKMSNLLESITDLIDTKNIKINKPDLGYEQNTTENEPLTCDYIYPRIQSFIKENDIVIAETGSVPSGVSKIKFPNNVDVQFQILWGSIGWGTPAALGAGLAKQNSRVILITGEGAHQISA